MLEIRSATTAHEQDDEEQGIRGAESLLPMKAIVLLALSWGDAHTSQLVRRVATRTDDVVHLSDTTVVAPFRFRAP
jgi:hypothetical protein